MNETVLERAADAVNELLENHEFNPKVFARVVLFSIRLPDKRMLRAAAKAMSPDKRPTSKYVSVARKHAIRWQAMIDAILEEKD